MNDAPSRQHGWFAEFRRRRMFRAMVTYFLGSWLVLQIASVTFPPLGLPEWMQRALIIALAVGVVPAFILAWIYDFTAHGVVRTDAAPAAGTLPAATTAPSATPVVRAVEIHGETAAADESCDGLAEEIIDSLCCVRRLRVASRTASFRYRDGSVDPREIGSQLRVGAILEGSVRKAGERVRITAQLIDAVSGFHLWSETYDRTLEDVFAIQTEIARKVSAALRVSLTGDELARRERYAPKNPRAHEFYLRGRQLVASIGVTEWRQSPALFRRAIELDPDYAQAHAGLADVLTQLILWRFAKAEDVLPEATRAANRALELAPDLAEAHLAVAHVRSLTGDDDGAVRSFERALELNPELFEAHYYFARHCQARGDDARAAKLFRSAFAVRPDEYATLALAVPVLDRLGRHADADAAAGEAIEGLTHQVELDPDNPRNQYMLAGMLARCGRSAEGKPHVEAALRLRPDDYATLYNAACFYSLAGDTERAIDMLERAFASGGGSRDWIEHDADFDALRGDPRFRRLFESLGDKAAPREPR